MTAIGLCMTSAFWMIIATFMGLLGATELIAPDIAKNIGWLAFGRIRPIHINLVLFGFVTPGLLAAAFYYLPRLLRTDLYSEKLGAITVGIWNIMLVAVVVTLSSGYTQGREYAEMIWPVDMLVVIVFCMLFINLIMTVKNRKEPVLYVSVWYVLAGIVLTSATYCLGNIIWRPDSGALAGIPDAIILWFYGHNVFGLLLTPLAAGVTYYIIPRACRTPLYSHTLSLLGFWSLLVVYTHIGTHHLLQVPVPTWLKVIAIVDSVGMVIPVMAFLINIWFTTRGKLGEIHADIGAKFVFTGTIMYFFVSIQGSMMSLPQVQRVTHFNNWVVGHAHIGVLGFAGMIALGGIYYILPKITGKPLFSRFLADLQYWLVLIGVVGFTVVLTIAGLIQGNAWLNGETIYRILPEIHMYYVVRASLGLIVFFSAIIGLVNISMTIYQMPGRDAMKMTTKAIVLGSLLILATIVFVVVLIPYMNRDETPSEIFRSRTQQESSGRKLYIANGCVYCHSQSIRSVDWGLGAERIAQAGDYVQDMPILLGSARTGPDLSQAGGEHPDDWHVAHFVNPRYARPLSIMPAFEFLGEVNVEKLIRYVQSLGLKNADQRMTRQNFWKAKTVRAYEAGPVENVKWLHKHVPEGWRNVPNPYPTTEAGLARGHKLYQDFCLGCHGPIGDGMGPAQPYIYPPPLNFTILKGRGVSGGILYYQIMNGITGTAMPYFKRELESEKIWDVGNYVAVYFINQSDANAEPRGIDAAYEP